MSNLRRMFNENILVDEVKTAEDKTASGLFIPTQPKSYKVVKVVLPDPENRVAIGEELCVQISAGTEVEVDGVTRLIVNVRDIKLVL